MTQKPVIFLAFANDRVDDAAYLRNLPKEQAGIRQVLEQARLAGLCEVVERNNATIKQLLDVFQSAEYRNRIAIFHYGGHANGYQLLLETLDGEHASAHAEGLASFLGKQQGLKLVFLNGCSSQAQAQSLLATGVPAVIGTSQSINDDVATQLAVRFYSGLSEGQAIEKAWEEAVDEAKIVKGTANMRDLFWEGTESTAATDRFPWEIGFREGAEIVRFWNLPEAVDNPLFGLPTIPPTYHLPETPYLYLQRYQRPQAEVFFGRSYYIRSLYNMVTDPKSPPLVLFYGQSGVGKSSLMDAGFKPRLERTHHIWYLRRDQGISIPLLFQQAASMKDSLLNKMASELSRQKPGQEEIDEETMKLNAFHEDLERLAAQQAKQLPDDMREHLYRLTLEMRAAKDFYLLSKKKRLRQYRQRLTLLQQQQEVSTLLDQWMQIEGATGKPLIIVIDQLESVFTVPDPNLPNEFEEFVADVQQLFGNPERLPQGKLILSYRKEYHPEIDERFKEAQVPRSRIFLKHLSRKDIMEVVKGLTLQGRTWQQYHVMVEEHLPAVIADDLLEDKESPIAPVLQIILTKMWQLSQPDEAGIRQFTVDLYQQIKQGGILMEDFYFQQMATLKAWNSEVVASGLALDVMMFHSSALMTADIRSQEELYAEYAENMDILPALIAKLIELYLLSGIDGTGGRRTTLAHDTLAPIVFKQYRLSDYPGQRARRILENKAASYDPADPSSTLDLADLAIVEHGHYGMRAWTPLEVALVEQSRKRREKVMLAKRNRRRVNIAFTILIALLGVLAGIEAWRARTQKRLAESHALEAHLAEMRAQQESVMARAAERNARNSEQLAKVAEQDALDQKGLAEEAQTRAEEAAQRALIAQQVAKQEALRAESAAEVAKKAEDKAQDNLLFAEIKKQEAESSARYADSLKTLAETRAMALKAISLNTGERMAEVGAVLALQAFDDMQRYEQGASDKDIYQALRNAWELLAPGEGTPELDHGETEGLLTLASGHMLLTAGTNGMLQLWQIRGGGDKSIWLDRLKQFPFCQTTDCYTQGIDVAPKRQLIAAAHTDHNVRLWRLDRADKHKNGDNDNVVRRHTTLSHHQTRLLGVFFFDEGNRLASIDASGEIAVWDPEKTAKPEAAKWMGASAIAAAKHPNEDALIVALPNRQLYRVDLATLEAELWMPNIIVTGKPSVIQFSPNGNMLALGMEDGNVMLFRYEPEGFLDNPEAAFINEWQAHGSKITDLAFHPKGLMLASCSYDRRLKVYPLGNVRSGMPDPRPLIDMPQNGWVMQAAFLNEGTHVAFGGAFRQLHLYDTDAQQLVRRIKALLRDRLTSDESRQEVLAELEAAVKGRSDYEAMVQKAIGP